jgi:uncharacterized peroxidase-related enzyme
MLAHGAVLRRNFFASAQLAAIARDFRNAGLSEQEVAVMSFAQKVCTRAAQLSEADYAELRAYGLSDEEILDVVLASTARSFFTKTLDALGAVPDDSFAELEPEILEAFTQGRQFP